jgi:hypothetical protein
MEKSLKRRECQGWKSSTSKYALVASIGLGHTDKLPIFAQCTLDIFKAFVKVMINRENVHLCVSGRSHYTEDCSGQSKSVRWCCAYWSCSCRRSIAGFPFHGSSTVLFVISFVIDVTIYDALLSHESV